MKLSRRTVLKAGAALAVGGVGVDAFAIEPRRLRFERVTVPIADLPEPFHGYRIAFLTDVHYPRNIDRGFINEAIAMGNAFGPDLWTFGGDLIDTKGLSAVPTLAGVFEHAWAKDGTYGVLGNHDWHLDGPETIREVERTSPIRFLHNRHVLLNRGGESIALAGLEDLWEREPDLELALKGVTPEMPRLLLSHNPDTAELYVGSTGLAESRRVDLQLSGHTHGGEIVLPFFGAPKIPSRYGRKFDQGLVQGALHRVYVGRGIASPRKVRFRCRPEVTGITLVRA